MYHRVIEIWLLSFVLLILFATIAKLWDYHQWTLDATAEDPYDTSHFHREFNGTSVSAKTPSYDLSNSQNSMTSVIEELRDRVDKMYSALERLWCLTKNVMSTGGFCVTEENIYTGGNHNFDIMLCQYIEQLVGNSSIADLGAGIGYYGMCLLRRKTSPFRIEKTLSELHVKKFLNQVGNHKGGLNLDTPQEVYSWHGFDGAFNIDTLSGGFIEFADLSTERLWLGRRWDWIMSIEVGEHIPPEKEDFFIDNLVRHACKGLILSWALPGQPGHHHVNGQTNDYIIRKMADRGIVNEPEIQAKLRESVILNYLKQTAMVFKLPDPTNCLMY